MASGGLVDLLMFFACVLEHNIYYASEFSVSATSFELVSCIICPRSLIMQLKQVLLPVASARP